MKITLFLAAASIASFLAANPVYASAACCMGLPCCDGGPCCG